MHIEAELQLGVAVELEEAQRVVHHALDLAGRAVDGERPVGPPVPLDAVVKEELGQAEDVVVVAVGEDQGLDVQGADAECQQAVGQVPARIDGHAAIDDVRRRILPPARRARIHAEEADRQVSARSRHRKLPTNGWSEAL